MSENSKKEADSKLGLDADISRRDFVNNMLVGSGAGLLTMAAPDLAVAQSKKSSGKTTGFVGLGEDWTGPGGIGDYAESNGNTAEVVNAAHAVRDGQFRELPADIIDTGEIYDIVAVGGGFAGLSTAFTTLTEFGGKKNCLVLDNHPIFGGEAKQNDFEVDGYHLSAPQGSNGFIWPPGPAEKAGLFHRYWNDVGLPSELEWKTEAENLDKDLKFPTDHFTSMGSEAENATTGFFYRDAKTGKGEWALDVHASGFENAPISDQLKADLREIYSREPLDFDIPENWPEWLDSMTLKEFLTQEMGLLPEVCDYIKGTVSTSGGGLSPDVISAYSAVQYFAPPASRIYASARKQFQKSMDNEEFTLVSFPGGNSGIARYFVKKMIPDSIEGGTSLPEVLGNNLNWDTLDREGQPVRIRGRSMVYYVAHDGAPKDAEYVNVVYTDTLSGKSYMVKARGVVMASGGWVNKHIVRDLPRSFRDAYKEFYHAPILTANVAVRNWKYLEKVGISGAQWFDGFGWFTNLRAPLKLGKQTMPLDPDKPAVLTFYVHFLKDNIPLQAQAILSRTELFSTPYRDFELQIRQQLTDMFGDYGFDAKKDIAGIVLNRWGHAYIVPQPGYYFGSGGNPAPREVIREGYGRISFGHSELTGEQLWSNAVSEGEKATRQLFNKLS